MKRALILAALLASTTAAHAGGRARSRTVAQVLAGVGTGLSAGLTLTSVLINKYDETANTPMLIVGLSTSVITPSLGQIYAGDYLTWGMTIRAVSGAMIAIGALGFTAHKHCLEQGPMGTFVDTTCAELTQQSVVIMGLGAIGYIGGVAWDVLDTGDAVDRYNRTQGVYVAPTASVIHTPTGHDVPMVGLVGTF